MHKREAALGRRAVRGKGLDASMGAGGAVSPSLNAKGGSTVTPALERTPYTAVYPPLALRHTPSTTLRPTPLLHCNAIYLLLRLDAIYPLLYPRRTSPLARRRTPLLHCGVLPSCTAMRLFFFPSAGGGSPQCTLYFFLMFLFFS